MSRRYLRKPRKPSDSDREISLEEAVQNVEDSFLSGSGSSKSIGARVREIVTENLKEPDRTLLNKSAEEAMAKSMQEENQILQTELNRVEDLLAEARADRDEIRVKYNAVSGRVS